MKFVRNDVRRARINVETFMCMTEKENILFIANVNSTILV